MWYLGKMTKWFLSISRERTTQVKKGQVRRPWGRSSVQGTGRSSVQGTERTNRNWGHNPTVSLIVGFWLKMGKRTNNLTSLLLKYHWHEVGMCKKSSYLFTYNSRSKFWTILSPKGHLAMSRDIVHCHNCGKCYEHLEGRDQGCC